MSVFGTPRPDKQSGAVPAGAADQGRGAGGLPSTGVGSSRALNPKPYMLCPQAPQTEAEAQEACRARVWHFVKP